MSVTLASSAKKAAFNLAASTAKRVVVYRFDRQPIEGFVNPLTHLQPTGVEVLTTSGTVQMLDYGELKALCFVSEFGRHELFDGASTFERRPRVPGLWTRFTLRDGDRIDGILSSNLADWPAYGFMFTPPRPTSSRQKVFLARESITHSDFFGVIGIPTLSRPRKALPNEQLQMFD